MTHHRIENAAYSDLFMVSLPEYINTLEGWSSSYDDNVLMLSYGEEVDVRITDETYNASGNEAVTSRKRISLVRGEDYGIRRLWFFSDTLSVDIFSDANFIAFVFNHGGGVYTHLFIGGLNSLTGPQDNIVLGTTYSEMTSFYRGGVRYYGFYPLLYLSTSNIAYLSEDGFLSYSYFYSPLTHIDEPEYRLMQASPSQFNKNNFLMPINFIYEIGGTADFWGTMPGMRLVNIADLNPEQIVTIGDQRWQVFPFAKKTAFNNSNNATVDQLRTPTSYHYGIAYLVAS